MYLTSYVMLLRRPAIAPAEWVGGELRWYVACVCDPVLISTIVRPDTKRSSAALRNRAAQPSRTSRTTNHNRYSAETRGQAIRAVFSALILKLVAAGIAKKARDGLWHLGQLIDKLYLLNPLIQASTTYVLN